MPKALSSTTGRPQRSTSPIRAGTHVGLPVSCGLAMFPEDGSDLETLVRIQLASEREQAAHCPARLELIRDRFVSLR